MTASGPADVSISADEAKRRTIKRSDYVSCMVAFIDCKTPGSHLKENYSLIGPRRGMCSTPSSKAGATRRQPSGSFASCSTACNTLPG